MRKLLWIFLTVVPGCGGAFGGKQTSNNHSSDPAPAASPDPDPGAGGAMIFDNDAALPPCEESRDGALVYVKDTQTFRACAGGSWSAIDLKGEKGEKGDAGERGTPGAATETTAAVDLYRDYRKSVFRVLLTCTLKDPPFADSCVGEPTTIGMLGGAFLCDDSVLCSNTHVFTCSECYAFTRIDVQATKGDTDSINPDGTPTTPFFTTTAADAVKKHATYDLAKLPVTGVPDGAKVMPLTSEPSADSVQNLAPILSLSYPLGFQDLYVDVGYVNNRYIGECAEQGGASGYGCPRTAYDFSTSNDTDHGSSGSPLLNISSGKVVGVTTAGTEGENANYTWAIDASRFEDVP